MGSVLGVTPSSFLEVPACHVGRGGGISPVAVSLPQPSLPIEFLIEFLPSSACLEPDDLTTIYLVLLSSFIDNLISVLISILCFFLLVLPTC